MFSNLNKKNKQLILDQVKRQIYKKQNIYAEDNRPVESIKLLYSQLNKELFENSLPSIEVKFNSRLRKTLGKASYIVDTSGNLVPIKIEIKKNHKWSNRFLRKVMIHEMCHVWAFHFHNEKKHGPNFWCKMKELGYPNTHHWEDALDCEKDIYS